MFGNKRFQMTFGNNFGNNGNNFGNNGNNNNNSVENFLQQQKLNEINRNLEQIKNQQLLNQIGRSNQVGGSRYTGGPTSFSGTVLAVILGVPIITIIVSLSIIWETRLFIIFGTVAAAILGYLKFKKHYQLVKQPNSSQSEISISSKTEILSQTSTPVQISESADRTTQLQPKELLAVKSPIINERVEIHKNDSTPTNTVKPTSKPSGFMVGLEQIIRQGEAEFAADYLSWFHVMDKTSDETALETIKKYAEINPKILNGQYDEKTHVYQDGAPIEDLFGFTVLEYAVLRNRFKIVELLISLGSRIDTNSNRISILAFARNGKMVKLLIKNGVDVNHQSESFSFPLIFATNDGQLEVVRALLSAGANTEAKIENGMTALHAAASNGQAVIVAELLKAGANIEAKDSQGYTALNFAAYNGHTQIVRALLVAGANISACDINQENSLMKASRNGQIDAVRALLSAGADVSAKDIDGETAQMKATHKGYKEIIALFPRGCPKFS